MDLVDFIRESNNSENSTDLVNCYLRFLESFGINQFMMFDLTGKTVPENANRIEVLLTHPDDAAKFFNSDRCVDYESVYRKALSSKTPFPYEEERVNDLSRTVLKVLNDTDELALCDGIGVPIHQPLGKVIGIGLTTQEKYLKYDKDVLSLLHAASLHFFMVYSRLVSNTESVGSDIKLTDREREVLSWIARGKSKSETASTLSISESSVKRHCENIFSKLQVNNLPSAVAKALSMGLINPY